MKKLFFRIVAFLSPLFVAVFFASPALAAPFSLSTPTPSQTFVFADTVISADFSMPAGKFLDYCELFVDGFDSGEMVRTAGDYSAGTVSIHHTYDTAVSHPTRVDCYNDLGEMVSRSFSMTVFADFDDPSVTGLAPATAVAGTPVSISASYNDTEFGSGMDYCTLSIDGIGTGVDMTLSGGIGSTLGTASQSRTFTAGTHSVGVVCNDRSGNSGYQLGSINVSAPADTTDPVTGFLGNSPSGPSVGTPVTFSVNPTDNVGVASCSLYRGGVVEGAMSLSGSTYSRDYTFTNTSEQWFFARCLDEAGNSSSSNDVYITASAVTTDTTAPVVGLPGPATVTAGSSVSISSTFTDAVGVTSCSLSVNGTTIGSMSLSGTTSGTASRNYTFPSVGTYTVRVTCADAAGNSGYYQTSVTASAVTTDTTPPTVSVLSPSTAVQDTEVSLTATFSDANPVANCFLHIQTATSGMNTYTMARNGSDNGYASFTWTYFSASTPAGAYNAYVTCTDGAGNTGTGPTTAISVRSADSLGPYATRLVKLACPTSGFIDVNHPCKAVYYVDGTGKRHAFPNERTFFTWYAGFDSVIELGSSELSSFPLGQNVNYRPGVRMVKFTTLNKVYAVGRYGELRWVTSESVATSLYGGDWNTKIDDISDAFYGDYTFGADITTPGLYSTSYETWIVPSIESNIR